MSCTFDLGLNGLDRDAVGLPTRVEVYARVQGSCTRVQLTVRQAQGTSPLFTQAVTPDSNGTCSIDFPLPSTIFPCGFKLWVDAQCLDGDSGATGGFVALDCKGLPRADGDNSNSPGQNDVNWPWGLPSSLFCPLMGRSFAAALQLGLLTLIVGIALALPVAIATGAVMLEGAIAIQATWMRWCNVSDCNYWGAILWVLKRGTISAAVFALLTAKVIMLLVAVTLGVLAGMVTQRLRASRCPLPSAKTSLQQLPLW